MTRIMAERRGRGMAIVVYKDGHFPQEWTRVHRGPFFERRVLRAMRRCWRAVR